MNALNVFSSDTAVHQQARIRKVDKYFAKKLDFKNLKFPVQISDIQKIEKKNCIGINVFWL